MLHLRVLHHGRELLERSVAVLAFVRVGCPATTTTILKHHLTVVANQVRGGPLREAVDLPAGILCTTAPAARAGFHVGNSVSTGPEPHLAAANFRCKVR